MEEDVRQALPFRELVTDRAGARRRIFPAAIQPPASAARPGQARAEPDLRGLVAPE